MKKKCIDCIEYKRCKDSYTSWLFFIIGIIATIAVRVVTVLMDVNPFYGKIAWYIGICGFLVFFIYKFKVNQTRARIIQRKDLIGKLRGKQKLTDEEYDMIGALLCGISSKKERINFLFIFAVSAIALSWAAYVDFFK